MKIIKKFLSLIFNPLNNVSFGRSTEKLVSLFSNHPFLIFLVSLIVSAVIFIAGHNLF